MSSAVSRRCSHCGNNGHNSRTCLDNHGGFKLFGVRLSADCSISPAAARAESSSSSSTAMRKSVSMGNLCNYGTAEGGASPLSPPHYEHHDPGDPVEGYASDDLVHTSSTSRERKKGVPWTEEEHRMFLLGLQKLGKGDWRGISRNFVKTRTPTQVASHAQKYFLRRNNLNKRRRRSSLFDITPDTVSTLVEEPVLEEAGCDDPDVCPELTLGQSIPYGWTQGVEFSGQGNPLGGFPVQVQPFPLAYGPMRVSKLVVEAPNTNSMQMIDGDEIAEKGHVQRPLEIDVMEVVPEVNDDVEGGPNLLALGCPPIPPLWQSQGLYGTFKHDGWTESKIVKPIPVVPRAPEKDEETSKYLTLNSNVGQRVMEPSLLSYKLLEEGSRHSAFHAASCPAGNGEVEGQGSLSSAISVP